MCGGANGWRLGRVVALEAVPFAGGARVGTNGGGWFCRIVVVIVVTVSWVGGVVQGDGGNGIVVGAAWWVGGGCRVFVVGGWTRSRYCLGGFLMSRSRSGEVQGRGFQIRAVAGEVAELGIRCGHWELRKRCRDWWKISRQLEDGSAGARRVWLVAVVVVVVVVVVVRHCGRVSFQLLARGKGSESSRLDVKRAWGREE